MSLPVEIEKAIGDEKSKRPAVGDDHDFAQLIAETAQKDTKEKEEKEEPKPEVVDRATEALSKALGHRKSKKKEEADEKKEEKPKEEAKDDTVGGEDSGDKKPATGEQTDDGPVEEGKIDKPKKGKISKKPDIDPIEIASAAAARTAQSFMEANEASRAKVAEKADGKGLEETLSEEERGELEVFKEMAKSDTRFKELPRQYLAYLKKAEDYQRQWEKDHPNEEFDPEAADHDLFYRKHQPKYSELEHKKAIARMESKSSNNKELEELRAEQKRLKAENAARDLAPIISQTSIGALAEVIRGIDENMLKSIEKEGFQKYAEANETEADLIKSVADRMGPFITGLLQFDDPDGRIPFNKENPAHMEAVRYLKEKEDDLRKKGWRDRMTDDGKILVPRSEYFRMTDSQKAQHAYLDTQMLIQLRIAEEAEKAQAQYQKDLKKAEARAKALGWSPPSSKKNGHEEKKEEPEKEEEAPPARSEIKSPEATSSSRVDTTGATKSGNTKDVLDLTADVLFRR